VFVGTQEEYDIYVCPNEPTIVMRRSSEPSDYLSSEELLSKIDMPEMKRLVAAKLQKIRFENGT
jgi:hypothetical protein